jgi:hypothetical protein
MFAILATAAALAAPPAGYREVQTLDLTSTFRAKTPWTMHLLQPIGLDAETGDRSAKVCLTGGKDGATHCEDLVADGYKLQTIKSAGVETLSSKAGVKGVVVRAEFGGVAHVLRSTQVWTYMAATDSFLRTSGFSRSDIGDEERFSSGPMDGFYIVADFLLSGDENRWSDHRYSIEIYQLDPRYDGYVQVLQYLSPGRYPSERDKPHQVIDGELNRARGMLAAVYPHGIQAGAEPEQ